MTLKISNKFETNADLIYYPGDVIDLMEQIPNEFVQLIITSPPYNLGNLDSSLKCNFDGQKGGKLR
jgi:adenine-specific DNA-methyltransferase